MVIIKINKQAYKTKKDNPFKNFAGGVVDKGKGNPAYERQAALITEVETRYAAYAASLTLAEGFGGTDRTGVKNTDRQALEESLDKLVESLDAEAKDKPAPAAFLEYLGFELAKKPSRRTGSVQYPIIKSLKSGGDDSRRGVVKCILKADDPNEIKGIIGERSDDNGLMWANGIYSPKLSFEMRDQPSGVYAQYRFRFIATNGRESDWSPFEGVSII